MQKDFTKWHALKEKIHNDRPIQEFRERDVWWCSLGVNIGAEEDGKNKIFERPVLVLRKFNKEIFFGVPLTSQAKENIYYFPFSLRTVKSNAILSQMRLLSAKRFVRKIGRIGKKQYFQIQKRVAELITKETTPLRESRMPSGNLYIQDTK